MKKKGKDVKIIHFADLHIGSKFSRLPEDIKSDLQTKLRNAFSKIIEYAVKNEIKIVLMAGDIFDKNAVLLRDKELFYNSIKLHPNIDFYYLKGNHDYLSKYNEEIPNLHLFNGLESYTNGNIRISGYELGKNNNELYNHPPFSKGNFNILMLHGDIFNSRDANYIDLKRLRDKNIDYLALGHIHKRSEDTKEGIHYAYPGCVIGRGFDECEEKGFLVLDTLTGKTEFHALSSIIFEHFDISIGGLNEVELKDEISKQLKEIDRAKITEIRLVGKASFDIDSNYLERSFAEWRYFLTIKNESSSFLQYKPNETENSLLNIFINKVLTDEDLNEEYKEKAIEYGLSILLKEEG